MTHDASQSRAKWLRELYVMRYCRGAKTIQRRPCQTQLPAAAAPLLCRRAQPSQYTAVSDREREHITRGRRGCDCVCLCAKSLNSQRAQKMEQAQGEVEDKSKATTAAGTSASPSTEQAATAGAADTKQSSSAGGREEENRSPSRDGAKGKEGAGDAAGMWMYLDGANPTQHGPLTESLMLKLLRIGTAHKDMMAWSQGMSEWQPLGQVGLGLGASHPNVLHYILLHFWVC